MRVSGAVPPGLRAVLVVVATSVLMVLIAWSTLIGPDAVFTGPGPTPSTITTTTTTTAAPIDDDSADELLKAVQRSEPPLWLKLIVWAFELLVLVAMVAFAGFLLFHATRLWKRRFRPSGVRDEIEFATLDEPDRIAAAMVADAAEQDAALRDGDARNAIVAVWRRFEVQGARAGVERESWETSSEFALRMLDRVQADHEAVNRLAGLYREARFSDHEIDESHRATALTALEQIRRSLAVRS